MQNDLTIIIIGVIIGSIFLLTSVLLFSSIVRRISHDRRYRILDILRQEYGHCLRDMFDADTCADYVDPRTPAPGSLAWEAREEVLLGLMDQEGHRDELAALFSRLGYVTYHENRLSSRNVLIKASAVDKLGRMRSRASLTKLLPLLEEKEPEILTVTVRALSRIGAEEGLTAIIRRLPFLLGKTLVTRKAMETALLSVGAAVIPHLIDYQGDGADPWIVSCVLETLSHLPPDMRSSTYAIKYLGSPNAEVRSKALKVLGKSGATAPAEVSAWIPSLLNDPVWFVRIQAIKVAERLAYEATAKPLSHLLFDANWHVRDQAALALTRFGNRSIGIFLEALTTTDKYAKESVCEEIERTGFSDLLIKNLGDADRSFSDASREILKIMHGMRFSTPLVEYVEHGKDPRIREEILSLLPGEQKP
jgi:HEAT repeat protein